MGLAKKFLGLAVLGVATTLAGCGVPSGTVTSTREAAVLPDGPPIEDITTPFDTALRCLRDTIPAEVSFAVGQVVDSTGKESFSEGGTGKMISQGAGEMVQSALFRAGVTVVNRRDPNIPITETNWGIRDIKKQTPVNFYVSGSINSLDFIPGGGASLEVGGIGPRYRQNRILIGLDLSLTDALTGLVVANIPLQKQIFAKEIGFTAGEFFGPTLISLDVGGMEREAVHFSLRQMLSLATFELLGQISGPASLDTCRSEFENLSPSSRVDEDERADFALNPERIAAIVSNSVGSAASAQTAQEQAQQSGQGSSVPSAEDQEIARIAAERLARELAAQEAQPVPPAALKLGRRATALAARSIAAAENAANAKDPTEAETYANEAMQLMAVAVQALRQGAEIGLSGPEGDAAALIVEQAVVSAQAAKKIAAELALKVEAASVERVTDNSVASDPETQPQQGDGASPKPGTPEYERKMGGDRP
jgi:hypothetical protein